MRSIIKQGVVGGVGPTLIASVKFSVVCFSQGQNMMISDKDISKIKGDVFSETQCMGLVTTLVLLFDPYTNVNSTESV